MANETILITPDSAGPAYLYILQKNGSVETVKLNDSVTTIGAKRPGSKADIQLDSPIVSGTHGEIQFIGTEYCYCDKDSLNGTFVNGIGYGKGAYKDPTAQNIRNVCRLKNGSTIRIDQKNLNKAHKDAVLMVFLTGDVSRDWSTLNLTDKTGDIEIGRSKDSDLQFADQAISAKHATFYYNEDGSWTIADHNSKNGVFVNGERLYQPHDLRMMDVIQIAHTTFIYLGDRMLYNVFESKSDALSINIHERKVGLIRPKRLLKNINMTICPGEFVLVLGGSGAGKSVFMDALRGADKADAEIIYYGEDVYKDNAKFRNMIGYVSADDVIRDKDTVKDIVRDFAQMRSNFSPKELEAKIDEVLGTLGLTDQKNTLFSSLSKGEKRRVAIATAQICDPRLFLLDEPDSGLDGPTGREVLVQLRKAADTGRIVIIITHAPDNGIDLFDKVLVLAKHSKEGSGQMAYFGPVKDALQFFEVHQLKEIVGRINPKDRGGDGLADHYIDKYKKLSEEHHYGRH